MANSLPSLSRLGLSKVQPTGVSPPPLRRKRMRTLSYEDGSVYKGEAEGPTPQGRGALTYPDGKIYEGEFDGGVIQGFGKLTFEPASKFKTYKGWWRNGAFEGHGTLVFSNSGVYEGEFIDGKASGRGKRTFGPDEKFDMYEGKWEDDKFHGEGVLTYRVKRTTRYRERQAIRYEGNFHLGSRQGNGILTFDDGTIYDGGFENDRIRGAGSLEQNGIVHRVNTGEDGIMKFLQ